MTPTVPDLHDDVISLRPPQMSDVDAITAAVQDPDIPRFTRIPSPYSRDDAVDFVRQAAKSWRTGRSPKIERAGGDVGYAFVILERAGGALIGSVGIGHGPRQRGEIGYWVASEARGGGMATRAAILASRWAIPTLGLARLELMTRPDNLASQKVAERAGLTREGLLRSYDTVGCGISDVVMFSLLPADLEPGL